MASLSIPYSDFVSGTTIVSQQTDDNNAAIVNYINARNAATATWDAVSTVGAFTSTLTSNQIILGTTRTVTLTAPTPASASRTYTIPDPGADASFVMTLLAQTITGAKTFASSTLLLQEASGTDVATIAVASLAASRTYTVPDAGAAASFVMSEGAQTVNGAKTFGSGIVIGGNTTGDSNLGTISSVTNSSYYKGTFTGTFTGAFNSGSKTFDYRKIGNSVSIQIGFFLATAGSAATLATGAATIPSSLRPTASIAFPIQIRDNGTIQTSPGLLTIGSDGNIIIAKTLASGTFTGSGSTGLESDFSANYVVA